MQNKCLNAVLIITQKTEKKYFHRDILVSVYSSVMGWGLTVLLLALR